jgi:hypothetical protein
LTDFVQDTSLVRLFMACASIGSKPKKLPRNDWYSLLVCDYFYGLNPLLTESRRRSPRRQGVPIVPQSRPQSSDPSHGQFKHPAAPRAIPSLSRPRKRYLRRLPYPRPYRIAPRTCRAHCWIIRGCFCGYNRMEAEPGELRQRLQPKQTYMELGQS